MKSLSAVATVIAVVLVFSAVPSAFANDMNAVLIPTVDSARVTYIADYSIEMTYPAGSSLAQDLAGRNEYRFTVQGTPDSTENGIADAIVAFNEAFLQEQSPVNVSNMTISYFSKVEGGSTGAVMSYRIQANVDLENFVLGHDQGSDILDLEFRSIEVTDPIVLNTEIGQIDISRPIGILETKHPEAAQKISASQATADIFEEPIIDFKAFNQSMRTWHVLFDPTGSLAGVSGFEEVGGARAVSIYSLGESSFREGTFEDEEKSVTATVDGSQVRIHSIVPKPSGQIQIAGFSTVADYGGETAYVSEERTGGGSNFTLQVLLILGGMMGAIAVFILWKAKK